MDREATRTTVFGVLMLSGGPHLTLSQFVALAGSAGIPEGTVKAQVSRMVLDGSLVRTPGDGRSVYAVSARRTRVVAALRDRMSDRAERWDGRWLMAAVSLPRERPRRARWARRLRFHGFRSWARGAYLRPAWPGGWAEASLAQSVDAGAAVSVVGEVLPAPPVDLWDLDALDRRFRDAAARIRRRSVAVDPSRAFATRLAIGALLVRAFSDDPFLPPELWGRRRGRSALVARHAEADRRLARAAEPYLRAVLGRDDSRRTA